MLLWQAFECLVLEQMERFTARLSFSVQKASLLLLVKGEFIPSASSVLGLSLSRLCQLCYASAKLRDDFVMWANIPQWFSFNQMHKSEALLNSTVTKNNCFREIWKKYVWVLKHVHTQKWKPCHTSERLCKAVPTDSNSHSKLTLNLQHFLL